MLTVIQKQIISFFINFGISSLYNFQYGKSILATMLFYIHFIPFFVKSVVFFLLYDCYAWICGTNVPCYSNDNIKATQFASRREVDDLSISYIYCIVLVRGSLKNYQITS